MKLLMNIRSYASIHAKRFMHSLNEKNSSILSLLAGILSALLIYLLDTLVKGTAEWTKHFSVTAWLIVANILVFLLPILAVCSIFFGITGIRYALKKNWLWIIVCVLGILLGVMPLLLSGVYRSMWFKILYF